MSISVCTTKCVRQPESGRWGAALRRSRLSHSMDISLFSVQCFLSYANFFLLIWLSTPCRWFHSWQPSPLSCVADFAYRSWSKQQSNTVWSMPSNVEAGEGFRTAAANKICFDNFAASVALTALLPLHLSTHLSVAKLSALRQIRKKKRHRHVIPANSDPIKKMRPTWTIDIATATLWPVAENSPLGLLVQLLFTNASPSATSGIAIGRVLDMGGSWFTCFACTTGQGMLIGMSWDYVNTFVSTESGDQWVQLQGLGRILLLMNDNVHFTPTMVVITTLYSPDGCDYNSSLPMVVTTTLHSTPDCCDYNTTIMITPRAHYAPQSWKRPRDQKQKQKLSEMPSRVKYTIVLCTLTMMSKAAER